ncbi:Fimbrin [Trichostrongylus colubriformis]|uniref:Fimbrin n=1 Tax=Trichostrongylus colubriformis TaxID=6319 RepID=A0AAN8G0S7_TRICO
MYITNPRVYNRYWAMRKAKKTSAVEINGRIEIQMLTTEQLEDLSENFKTVYQDGTGFLPHSDLQAALKVLGIDIPGYKMRELSDRYGFSNSDKVELSRFALLFDELEQAKHQETNRKLVNLAVAGTIHEKAINKKNLNTYTKLENLTLALMSAQAIGCNIINIDNIDLSKGTPHLVLGLLWQIIRIGLFNQIDLQHCPGLFRLLREGETLDDLRKLSPEEILMRWVNYHMENANVSRRLTNFTTDINDSEIYTHLLHQIAPNGCGVTLSPLSVKGNVNRAAAMLDEAEKLDCREFVTPNDVASGNYKLNLAFVANLFNKHPNLPDPGADEIVEEVVEETREERTYRNWMNSMGVNPYVNWLYSDLQNGVIIFQLYDIIRPGIVQWKRVVRVFHKLRGMMDQIQNCNYAVELGKQLRFSLVGIQGKDIYDGNQTLTLALVWQLMRAYTLTILAQCTQSGDSLPADKDIVAWVNRKLASCGKTSSIRSFQDSSISDARVVLDLIDAIKPNVIDYSLVSNSNNMENAKYAITCGRKIGAKIYALPEDIVEVKPKMVMTVFACLMARDYMPDMRESIPEPVYPTSYS